MSEFPDIKPSVNKGAEPKRERRSAGLFARWFGGAGTSGLGSAGEGLGIASGGGLLATKAGLMMMILVGTTVAGAVGLIGYRLFGPGAADAIGAGDGLQLFAKKTQEVKKADSVSQDGSSASLQYLTQANPPTPTDKTAASEKADDPSGSSINGSAGVSANAAGPINKGAESGNGANKGIMMKAVAKFGALSTTGSTGSGGASGSSVPPRTLTDNASIKAVSNGFKRAAPAAVTASAARSAASRHFKNAASQAFGVLRDNRGASSSYSAGRTYDGAATAASNIGVSGGAIAAAPSVESGTAQQKVTAGANTDTKKTEVPTPTSTDEAPWQNSIKVAEGLLALGGLLLYAMSKLGKVNPIIFYGLNAIVALIAAAIIAIGAQISGGQYGQKLQGEILAAAGAGLILGATMAAVQGPSSATDAKAGSGGIAGINPYVLIGGGAALIGLAASMMTPLKKYPSTDFQNGNAPDSHWFGRRERRSRDLIEIRVVSSSDPSALPSDS